MSITSSSCVVATAIMASPDHVLLCFFTLYLIAFSLLFSYLRVIYSHIKRFPEGFLWCLPQDISHISILCSLTGRCKGTWTQSHGYGGQSLQITRDQNPLPSAFSSATHHWQARKHQTWIGLRWHHSCWNNFLPDMETPKQPIRKVLMNLPH